ncbi:tRNA-dihydrouridine(47) synthase [NAD(P)(+)]-like [Odontomachus brunneus]|uniref:tRNA-dihydrouridine(47) synthase [NAD(P)(+)]-like n=1 Tax=Odontomachus brunneus TaxID=486640 RepID=UPI0013F1FB5D|nr:tRNA-dihydrouridine(47) synthase [NAD(P)(+)]-like [Odontomachus brunneus]
MAECDEKCNGNCSFDFSEDKQKGVCLIKEEFIIEDHVRQLSKQCLTETDKQKVFASTNAEDAEAQSSSDESAVKRFKQDDKKEKLRGQNKARPPPFKAPRELSLCPWIADQTVDESERKCLNQRCVFLHDRKEYLKIRPVDIGTECHIFNVTGKCPRGTTCRMGSRHLTEDGFNIVDEKRLEEYKKRSPSTMNQLSKDLQNKLRKHKYNFAKAEAIVKANDPSRKKMQLQYFKSNEPKNVDNRETRETEARDKPGSEVAAAESVHIVDNSNDVKAKCDVADRDASHESKRSRMGPVDDSDLIRLQPSEKRKIDWKNKILLSPLTTVGNLPFRRICKEYGADITCGEMALAPKILKGAQEEWALVKRHECEDLFGVQLCGNNPGVLTRCAQLLNREIGVDYIDLNLGCPIDLIYRQGGGSGMLNRLNVLETVVKSVSQVLDIPLSIKTRTGVYIDRPIAHNLMPKFHEWGVSMITVHGRSREQRYTKLADWDYIEKCALAAQPVPVYGNGDILSFDDYQRVKETYTTVQGITIGRGALIKPWIFTEIKERKLIDISSGERFDILRKYTNYGLEHWGSDTHGVETTRRFMLEWISFLHRYVPVGILERPPQRINERPPFYRGRNDMETLMASSNCADWVKLSEMLLGKVPDGFHFLPKHKANSWK